MTAWEDSQWQGDYKEALDNVKEDHDQTVLFE